MNTSSQPVTVVIPAFGRSGCVRRAVRSALAQDGVLVEVVVVDDGSPKPLERELGDLGPAVRFVRSHENRGPGPARNLGAEKASSETIAFLDSDDEWLPGKLTTQLPLLEPGTAVVGDYLMGDDRGTGREVKVSPRSLNSLARCSAIHPSTLVVWRDDMRRAGGFPARRECAEDWVFCARLLLSGVGFARVERPVATYNWTSASTTASHETRISHILGAVEEIEGDRRATRAQLSAVRAAGYARSAEVAANDADLRSAARFAGAAALAGSPREAMRVLRVPVSYGRGVGRRTLGRARP